MVIKKNLKKNAPPSPNLCNQKDDHQCFVFMRPYQKGTYKKSWIYWIGKAPNLLIIDPACACLERLGFQKARKDEINLTAPGIVSRCFRVTGVAIKWSPVNIIVSNELFISPYNVSLEVTIPYVGTLISYWNPRCCSQKQCIVILTVRISLPLYVRSFWNSCAFPMAQ